MNDVEQILNEVQGKHIVFLDDVTGGDDKEEVLCNEWLLEDRENRRLVLVSSIASRRKATMDEDTELNLEEYFVSSWTLDEYFKAVADNELFHAVEPRMDASNELDPVVTVDSDDIDGELVLHQEHVASKYYFAGGSVRFMFGYTTARVVAELDKAVKSLPNSMTGAIGTVGDRSVDVINRLYCGFRGNRQRIVSRYAASAIARFGGPTLIIVFASVLKEDSNAAMDGRMLGMSYSQR